MLNRSRIEATIKAEAKALEEAERRDRAVIKLREMLSHGQTVYTLCRYANRSAAKNRYIFAILIVTAEGKIKNISRLVCDALMMKWADCDGVWAESSSILINALSFALHGRKNKGRLPTSSFCHLVATPRRFRAGYTLEQQVL